jgi:hypothetical protein
MLRTCIRDTHFSDKCENIVFQVIYGHVSQSTVDGICGKNIL